MECSNLLWKPVLGAGVVILAGTLNPAMAQFKVKINATGVSKAMEFHLALNYTGSKGTIRMAASPAPMESLKAADWGIHFLGGQICELELVAEKGVFDRQVAFALVNPKTKEKEIIATYYFQLDGKAVKPALFFSDPQFKGWFTEADGAIVIAKPENKKSK